MSTDEASITLLVSLSGGTRVVTNTGWKARHVPTLGSTVCIIVGKDAANGAFYLKVTDVIYYPVRPCKMSSARPQMDNLVTLMLDGHELTEKDVDTILSGDNPFLVGRWALS